MAYRNSTAENIVQKFSVNAKRDVAAPVVGGIYTCLIDSADLTDADLQQDLTILGLPANTIIEEVGYEVTTQFAFGGTGTIEAEIGVTGATARYHDGIDTDGGSNEAALASDSSGTGTGNVPDLRTAATDVVVRFDSANENVADVTAGQMWVWVKYYMPLIGN